MARIQENLAKVREGVAAYESTRRSHEDATDAHDYILRQHEEEIRKHERMMREHRRSIHKYQQLSRDEERSSSLRFRFKEERNDRSRKRKRTTRNVSQEPLDQSHSRASQPQSHDQDAGGHINAYTAHPFARPPDPSPYLDPSISTAASPQPHSPSSHHPDDAFRTSLFDAMADDEGAAYWEGVYSQPIHIYSRPAVTTEEGTLERMSDEEYAEYVKRRMWERKNPELMREMRKKEKEERETSREKRERREGGRNEEKKHKSREGDAFRANVDEALERGKRRKDAKMWQAAWLAYLEEWDRLKSVQNGQLEGVALTKAIPWPLRPGQKSMNKDQVEAFFTNAPIGEGESRLGILKAERFRWHPDKIQHRFGGDNVDAETLKMVTSVFQTIDGLLAAERQRTGKD